MIAPAYTITCATAINCAFNKRYNPASPAKFRIKNKALITAFLLVIIKTEETAEVIPNTKNKIV